MHRRRCFNSMSHEFTAFLSTHIFQCKTYVVLTRQVRAMDHFIYYRILLHIYRGMYICDIIHVPYLGKCCYILRILFIYIYHTSHIWKYVYSIMKIYIYNTHRFKSTKVWNMINIWRKYVWKKKWKCYVLCSAKVRRITKKLYQ